MSANRQRVRTILAWGCWLLIACAAVGGLRYYTIDNAIDAWMPEHVASDAPSSYVIIAGPVDSFDADTLAFELGEKPSVKGCLSPGTFEMSDTAQPFSPKHLVISDDGNTVGVLCFGTATATDRELLVDVRDAIKQTHPDSSNELHLAGSAVFRETLNDYSQRRLPVVMNLITLLGFLLLLWMSRSFKTAFTAMAAITLAQITLVGLVSWTRTPMSMTLSMTPPLMMSLGLSYAAHFAMRRNVNRVMLLCLITTALGIGSFFLTDVAPIRQFAMWGVVGLILTWLAIVILVKPTEVKPALTQVRSKWIALVLRCRVVVIVLGIIGTLGSLWAVPYLSIETNPLNYFPDNAKAVRNQTWINDHLTGTLPFQVSIAPPEAPLPITEGQDGVKKIIDLRIIDPMASGKYWILADHNGLATLTDSFPRWQSRANEQHAKLSWSGVAVQLYTVGSLVTDIAATAFPAMLLVVFVVVLFVSRHFSVALISVWINLIPIALLAIIFPMTGAKLGLPALMIGAIAVGVAVDDTIHLVDAFRKSGNWSQVLQETWAPCFASSIISAACMACFTICPFVPTAQFGWLMSLAIMGALAGDLILFPAACAKLSRAV